jgi:hypothetical protein
MCDDGAAESGEGRHVRVVLRACVYCDQGVVRHRIVLRSLLREAHAGEPRLRRDPSRLAYHKGGDQGEGRRALLWAGGPQEDGGGLGLRMPGPRRRL